MANHEVDGWTIKLWVPVLMFRFTFSYRQSVLIACVDCVLVAVIYMLCLLFIVIFVMCINSILLG